MALGDQVWHCKVHFPDGLTLMDTASFGFTFETAGTAVALDPVVDVAPALLTFINGFHAGQTLSVAGFLSSAISRATNACSIDLINVTGHLSGEGLPSPAATVAFTLGAEVGSTGLPPQVALACGFRANYVSDLEHGPTATRASTDQAIDEGAPATHTVKSRPRASDRGRLFLGPLSVGTLNADNVSVAAGALSQIGIALDGLCGVHNSGLANEFTGAVWSRVLAAVKPIFFYYIDEGFATIRKRIDTAAARVHIWNTVTTVS